MNSPPTLGSLETRQRFTLGIALLSLALNFALGFYLWRKSGPVIGNLQIVGSQGEILELGELTHLPFGGQTKDRFGLQILGADGHVRAGLSGSPKETNLMLMNGTPEVFFSMTNNDYGTRISTIGGENLVLLDLPVKHPRSPDERPTVSLKKQGADFIIIGLEELSSFLVQSTQASPGEQPAVEQGMKE